MPRCTREPTRCCLWIVSSSSTVHLRDPHLKAVSGSALSNGGKSSMVARINTLAMSTIHPAALSLSIHAMLSLFHHRHIVAPCRLRRREPESGMPSHYLHQHPDLHQHPAVRLSMGDTLRPKKNQQPPQRRDMPFFLYVLDQIPLNFVGQFEVFLLLALRQAGQEIAITP